MNARYPLAAVMISIVVVLPASASVLSASSQAVGTKSSKADYLRVTQVQDELNTTMKDKNGATVASGATATTLPTSSEPGYILQKEGDGGGSPDPEVNPLISSPGDGREGGRLQVPVGSGRSTRPGTFSDDRGTNRGNGGNRRGGDPYAAPEPSTWMLLGVGLAVLGGYMTLRRRAIVES